MPTFAALLLLALGAPYDGTVQDAKRAAEATAQSFLQLVDAGKVDQTWDVAAKLLKGKVTREQWRLSIDAARAGTGKAGTRARDASYFSEILPNVPPGTYVVVDFGGKFEKQGRVRERVTTTYENGAWRVCGYFVNYDSEQDARPATR